MKRKKWLRRAGILLLALAAVDLAANGLLQTWRVRRYLTVHLESAFGRPVEVGRFTLQLLPSPRIEARSVTVGEDPAFGYEYFLRAESVTAGLHWSGLLRGRIQFGTFSFTRASLNLVRDSDGRWNLERWLPPTRGAAGRAAPMVGPMPLPVAASRLDRIEFEDGRINFKSETEKLPFAFVGVSGGVEQIAPGRWTLRLEAQPWRSGASLQAAGTLSVRGDIAGTSARLQPAEIRLHWGAASLADLVRLARGQDFGLRGEAVVDGVARSGSSPGEWTFHMEARARQIHRWDLTERRDNPSVNLLLDGRWNISANEVRIAALRVETPRSNAQGEALLALSASPSFELRIDSAGIQAADLLAWYRGFHGNVSEGVEAQGFLTGAASMSGWPITWNQVAFSSSGGSLRVPALEQPLRIGAFEGGRTLNRMSLEPVLISLGNSLEPAAAPSAKKEQAGRGRSRPPELRENSAQMAASHDFESGTGTLAFDAGAVRVQDISTIAAALGRPFERGWDLKGSAACSLRWTWQGSPRGVQLSGHIDVTKGALQVVGLNLPLVVNDAQLLWREGKRGAHLGSVAGFGAEWTGDLEEGGQSPADGATNWKFRLHADHVDAAELDRWTGPRARPGWLERLLPSLLGSNSLRAGATASASELIRQVRAEGEISVGELTIERLKLTGVRATASLRDLHFMAQDASAQWAGGAVSGTVNAQFLPKPRYAVNAVFEKIRLADLPAATSASRALADRLNGMASGEIHLTTEGVGREELLRTLEGRGRVQLRGIEFRGWDVGASLTAGSPRTGTSKWPAGEGEFAIRHGAISFDSLRLVSGREQIEASGAVAFARTLDLQFRTLAASKRVRKEDSPHRFLKIAGSLEAPRASIETHVQ